MKIGGILVAGTLWGADVDPLRTLAQHFSKTAELLQQQSTQLGSQINNNPAWKGADWLTDPEANLMVIKQHLGSNLEGGVTLRPPRGSHRTDPLREEWRRRIMDHYLHT